jgi:two-component system, NtrC family, nitrogen regulation sensor histidine kinase NtrY
MAYNPLRINILVRVIAIALTFFLMFNLAYQDAFSVTIILMFVLAVVQVASLIRFIDRANQDILDFFEAIKRNDFSIPGEGRKDHSYSQFLHQEFSAMIERLKQFRTNRDEHQQYLTTIVQHVGIGIITFDTGGKIQIMNIAARRLLKVGQIANIAELSTINEQLVSAFWKLRTGGRELMMVEIGGEERQFSIYAIELSLGGENYKLISLQNIRTELEEKEMEAWQKLVRVLTHEIMNSVTPISSLATTVEGEIVNHLDKDSPDVRITRDELEDIHLAVQTIQRRSEGLIRFVNDFRSLTHTPEPKFQRVNVTELFDQLSVLLKHEIEENHILFEVEVTPANLSISIDPELIQQVLINLIKNAVQALCEQDQRKIELAAFQDEKNNTVIVIRDNGPGIDEEAQTKIFIPFFTTKKTGSGIGLSLSRQIMRQHNGSISVRSKLNEGTEFILRF